MTLTDAVAEAEAATRPVSGAEGPDRPVRRWLRERRIDLFVALGYLAIACFTMKHLLLEGTDQIAEGNPRGQSFGELMLLHGAHVVTRGQWPFLAGGVNFPDGVNPLAVHGFLGLSVPLTPLTLWLGPTRTYAIAATVCLVATAYAWYHVLRKGFGRTRLAALVGGAFAGLGPAIVAHTQGDLGRTALFLVPFLIWWTLRLREPGRAWRNGVLLGLLATWQFFIDEEVLFLAVLGWLVFLVAYRFQHRAELRQAAPAFLRGLGVAVLTWAVLVAYPLWTQFTAPRWRPNTAFAIPHQADFFSFFAFASPSLGTWPVGRVHYAAMATEQNAFYGWPLVLLLIGALFVLRDTVVRALAGAGFVLALLSLGSRITLKGRYVHVPGPWRLFHHIPGLRAIQPVDLALAVVPFAVLVLALLVQRGSELVAELHRTRPEVPARIAWYGMLTAALVPLAPAPVHSLSAPLPRFVTDGTWRSYVPAGTSMVTVPAGSIGSTSFRWGVATDLELSFAGAVLGDAVTMASGTAKPQNVPDRQRAAVLADLRHGRVAAVVLIQRPPEEAKVEDAMRKTTSNLLGFYPQWVDGVWLWDLRAVR
jgi:hypothetical protein